MVERFDLDEGGFLGSPGRMVPDEFGDYVRVADYEVIARQIAELRAENMRLQNEWDNCDEMLQAVRAENARLRALPLKDEVERVLEEAKERLQFGFALDRDVNAAVRIKIDALLSRLRAREQPTHRHKRRGTEYVLLGFGRMQCDWWQIAGTGHHYLVDMHEVAIYRSVDDGSLWVRPLEEFEDGRFETLASPSEHGGGHG